MAQPNDLDSSLEDGAQHEEVTSSEGGFQHHVKGVTSKCRWVRKRGPKRGIPSTFEPSGCTQVMEVLRVIAQLASMFPSRGAFTVEEVVAFGFAMFPLSNLFASSGSVVVMPTTKQVVAKFSDGSRTGMRRKGLIVRGGSKGAYTVSLTEAGAALVLAGVWKPLPFHVMDAALKVAEGRFSLGIIIRR